MTKFVPDTSNPDAVPDPSRTLSAPLYRAAGGLAIGFVVLMFAGFSQEVAVTHSDSLTTLQRVYGGANTTRAFTGGYVEALSYLLFLGAIVIVARLYGRRSETARAARQVFLLLGAGLVAAIYAVGFPAGAAAVYGLQHGADIRSVAMVNDIRNYGFILQIAVQSAMALALGLAALTEGLFRKWVGWLGLVVGVLGVVAAPLSPNLVSTAWLVWWLGLAVLLLRGPRTPRASA